jgi:hypothetical protein
MNNVLTHTTSAPVTGGTEQHQPVQVRSHLVAAVVVTLLCFAPTGVAAVVYAGNVRTRLALGDVEGARKASAMARRLVWASVAMTLTFLLVVVVGANGYSDTH